jgi:hypothetical protein
MRLFQLYCNHDNFFMHEHMFHPENDTQPQCHSSSKRFKKVVSMLGSLFENVRTINFNMTISHHT